jgi:hypothetical protein
MCVVQIRIAKIQANDRCATNKIQEHLSKLHGYAMDE